MKRTNIFEDLYEIVNDYLRVQHTISGRKVNYVPQHSRSLLLNGLSKMRIEELRSEYGFSRYEIAIYTGRQIKVSRDYLFATGDWHEYIKKLCLENPLTMQTKR